MKRKLRIAAKVQKEAVVVEMVEEIYVTKMNDERELYDESKLRRSMEKAGTSPQIISKILKRTHKIIYDGIKTKELFRFVFKELEKEETEIGASTRYNLKKGIIEMSLGGGFVFEKFMARVLEKQGYSTELNKIVNGKYITHEIDVIAKKINEILMVEAKHHDKPWLGCSIQTALYVYARFLDVKDKFTKPMLVTNTKFSQQVIDYSKGAGIKLMGWNYPGGNSLGDNITKYKLYPITILPFKKQEIKNYLEEQILTCKDLLKKKDLSPEIKRRIEMLMK